MWSFVPTAIGAGLVMVFAAESTWRNPDAAMAHTLLHSMVVSHRMALSASADARFVAGGIHSAVAGPFVNLADWHSEIVSGSAGKFLITWPGAFVEGDKRSVSLHVAMAGVDLSDQLPAASAEQSVGRFTMVDANTGRVGNVLIPIPREEIEEGTPVIASLLR